jgi:hypothetical protein
MVFWLITLRSSLDVYQHFRVTCCFQLRCGCKWHAPSKDGNQTTLTSQYRWLQPTFSWCLNLMYNASLAIRKIYLMCVKYELGKFIISAQYLLSNPWQIILQPVTNNSWKRNLLWVIFISHTVYMLSSLTQILHHSEQTFNLFHKLNF